MKTNEKLKRMVNDKIDEFSEEIIALGEDIRSHPELGFKEFRTSELVARGFDSLGIPHETGIAVTGVKGILEGKSSKATVAYLGELDSVLVRAHPDADPETGAAHACGHNAQIANLIALARGLAESGVMEKLDGNISLMAVPAEEYVELEWRLEQKRAGRIEFLGGKPEFVRAGAFDDVQIALMTHQASMESPEVFSVKRASNGCIAKLVRYSGRASHAGGAPHKGVNALKAALIGLQAIDANRETFKDEDHIRVHPVITKGGELVNVVPADVRMETFVRGAGTEAIREAGIKVDRSIKAGAMAIGADVEIITLPGYMPSVEHEALSKIFLENAASLVGRERLWTSKFSGGSSDMGDISQIMPALEARVNGCSGRGHGADYTVKDPEAAYVLPAKAAAMTLIDLLADDAGGARAVMLSSRPPFDKNSYLDYMRSLTTEVNWNSSCCGQ